MKVCLQDTVRAVHIAKGTDVQNLISAAGVTAGSGTRFYKGAFVAGEKKDLFALSDRIVGR